MVTASPTNARVGGRVREAIEKSGIPMCELVTHMGIAHATLDRKLSGRRKFTIEELVLLSERLGIDPSQFLAGIKSGQGAKS